MARKKMLVYRQKRINTSATEAGPRSLRGVSPGIGQIVTDRLKTELGPSMPEVPSEWRQPELTADERKLADTVGRLGAESLIHPNMYRTGLSMGEVMSVGLPAARNGAGLLLEALRETGYLTTEINFEQVHAAMNAIRQGEL